jgi:hypothetical protein
MAVLLTRDQFREGVFARDRYTCVCCNRPGQDAHHIIERRLFRDGGYYLDNGATLCGPCHLKAESTVLTCDEIRTAAKITTVVLPEHFYPDERYDKWGNPYVEGKDLRLRGELMDDESVQKIIVGQFTNRVKYPRTWHLPWSPGFTSDDRVLADTSGLHGHEFVVTIKMDGEHTTMYRDGLHARSIDGQHAPDQSWVRNFHSQFAHEIPEGWRICGENLYAKHSIYYPRLSSYFMVYSIWNGLVCLPWKETQEWCSLMELQTVPVIISGFVWDEKWDKTAPDAFHKYSPNAYGADPENEGYVVRRADAFHLRDFSKAIAKYVRKNHVQTHGMHWRRRMIEPNGLLPEDF